MDAIATGREVSHFNYRLEEGCCYTIHGVKFQPNSAELLEFRAIGRDYECIFVQTTIAEPYNPPLRFPLYPKHLTKFDNVFERSNKTFVDIAGIVKYWHPVEQVGGRFYRGSFAGCKNSASVAVAHCRTSFTHCSLWIQKSKPHRSINTLTGLTKLV